MPIAGERVPFENGSATTRRGVLVENMGQTSLA